MKGFRTDSLVYHHECAWVVERPKVYFNKDLLCEGEPLKVIWREPLYSRIDLKQDFLLRISHLNDEGETADKVLEGHLVLDSWWPGFIQIVGTGKEELLKEGAYIARVFPAEGDSDEGGAVYEEHQFQVINRDEYWEQWRDLFGEEWDEPIFWDEIDGIQRGEITSRETSKQGEERALRRELLLGEELMRGLPVQDILAVLPEDVVWDAETILQLLGPIMSAFMLDERGRLPFRTTFSLNQSSSHMPHIDLTKVIWLLSVIGPACRDLGFDAYHSHISIAMNGETLDLRIDFEEPLRKIPYPSGLLLKNPEAAIDVVPEIFRVVEKTAGQYFKFKLDPSPYGVGIYFY
ncbi:MAG TPA: hypothetical protein VGC66_10565 [Pyrinomonadaceae bacterium]|jgi:hypothetical protein